MSKAFCRTAFIAYDQIQPEVKPSFAGRVVPTAAAIALCAVVSEPHGPHGPTKLYSPRIAGFAALFRTAGL